MIFSADKKPTEPGQYWAKPSHTGAAPFVASVHALVEGDFTKGEFELNVQLVNNWAPVRAVGWIWGDKVEFPHPPHLEGPA